MLDTILNDLKDRFGKVVGMAIAAIVIFFLVIFLGKMAWNKAFGTDTGTLKNTIAQQSQVIEQVTDLNQQNATNAAKDRTVQEEAKNDLVAHVEQKAKSEKAFDQLVLKLDKEYTPAPPKKPQAKAAAKPKAANPSVAPEPAVSEDPEDEARETARQQRNAALLQDTIWQAYELAAKPSA